LTLLSVVIGGSSRDLEKEKTTSLVFTALIRMSLKSAHAVLRVVSCSLDVRVEWVTGCVAAASVIYVDVVLHWARDIEVAQVEDKGQWTQ